MILKIFKQKYKNINTNNNFDDINTIQLSSKKERKIILLKNIFQIYLPLIFSITIFFILLFILFRLINQNPNIFNKRKLNRFEINSTINNSNITFNFTKNNEFLNIFENNKNSKDIYSENNIEYDIPEVYGKQKLKISFNYTEEIQKQLYKQLNYTIIESFPKNKLKFALCTIGKLENLNARDFIIYYLELGIDKIYIYDNNEIYGEKFEDVVQDFIDKNLVEIIDMRGNQTSYPQNYAYDACYHNHINEYDWFLFFDFDEYLYIENNSLNNFVQLPIFNNCSSIVYFWRHYTDNNELYYKNESPIKRFTIPIKEYMQIDKFAKEKSISRGGIKELTYMNSIHAPFFLNNTYNKKYLTCDTEGNIFWKFENNDDKNKNHITFQNAFLKHFQWRSTEEYCLKLGVRKFYKSYNWSLKDYKYLSNKYLKNNDYNEQKIIMLQKCLNLI